MDEAEKYWTKLSCIGCVVFLICVALFWAAFIYGIVFVIDAIKG